MSNLCSVEIRWSDVDPNLHIRHSVYYDWGTHVRMNFLQLLGCTLQVMKEKHFGPIIFREEAVFRKEILVTDTIQLSTTVLKSTRNFAKWTMQHEIIKNENTVAAILTIDGAWMDTNKRKLAIPPQFILDEFNKVEKPNIFQWVE